MESYIKLINYLCLTEIRVYRVVHGFSVLFCEANIKVTTVKLFQNSIFKSIIITYLN